MSMEGDMDISIGMDIDEMNFDGMDFMKSDFDENLGFNSHSSNAFDIDNDYLFHLATTVNDLETKESAMNAIGQTIASGTDLMRDTDAMMDFTSPSMTDMSMGSTTNSSKSYTNLHGMVTMMDSERPLSFDGHMSYRDTGMKKKRRHRRGSAHRRMRSDPEALRDAVFRASLDDFSLTGVAAPGPDVTHVSVPHVAPMNVPAIPTVNVTTNQAYLPDTMHTAPALPKLSGSSTRYHPNHQIQSNSNNTKRKSQNTSKNQRVKHYLCGKCGKPKKGHVCTAIPRIAPVMCTMGTQVDLNVTASDRTPEERVSISTFHSRVTGGSAA